MTRRLSHIRLVTKCETGNIASRVAGHESTDKKTTGRIWQKYGRKLRIRGSNMVGKTTKNQEKSGRRTTTGRLQTKTLQNKAGIREYGD